MGDYHPTRRMDGQERKRIILPGDGEVANETSDPTIVLQEGIREITATTLADDHAPRSEFRKQISEGKDDWGDGFFVEPEPVLVLRAPDASIQRTIPLSEIPGVEYGKKALSNEELEREEEARSSSRVVLPTAEREKLVSILTGRLFRYYAGRGPKDPRYNPFRDGIPELPAGSPQHLQPLPGTDLFPATDGQIHDYLRRFVAARVTVINKERFGGSIQDLSLRIQ